jgi:hypothetical protein
VRPRERLDRVLRPLRGPAGSRGKTSRVDVRCVLSSLDQRAQARYVWRGWRPDGRSMA